MKKIYALAVWVLVMHLSAKPQTARSFYLEFAAFPHWDMGLLAINFDSRFNPQEYGMGGRIGLGLASDWEYSDYVAVPVDLNYLFGKKKSHLEVGGGIIFLFPYGVAFGYPRKDINVSPHLYFGYRLQPLRRGFTLRVFTGSSLYKSENENVKSLASLYMGFTLGYKFGGLKQLKK